MKKFFLLTIVLLKLSVCIAQDPLQCLQADYYRTVSPSSGDLIKVQKAISACWTDEYFSFYTPSLGTVSFKIDNESRSKDADGYVMVSLMNAEDETTPRGFYDVEITYGKTKTIVINFTRSGTMYMLQNDHFVGDAEPAQAIRTKK